MRQKTVVRIIIEPLAVAVVLALAVRAAVHIYSIPSASMTPTLRAGDVVLVTRYGSGHPDSGEVIVFRDPRGDELLIKRVVAVPGELVESRLGRLHIGGFTKAEPYLADVTASGAIDSQIVPADSYFVMGDNRADSIDSRSFGSIPRRLVVGRARLILWSRGGPGARGVNLDRIFKCIH
jgi:signal peptidase I